MTDLELAEEAARAAAGVVRRWFGQVGQPTMKGRVDPVTVADREADRTIMDLIRAERPQDSFLTEESGRSGGASDRLWIIDPLDGTINFLHGVPHVGISIALHIDDQPRVAVILDVFRDELFYAEAGQGAHVDGSPIRVSNVTLLEESLVVTGFPYDRQQHAFEYARTLGGVLERVQGVRRAGSAALDFAFVAAGRYEAFWEYQLAPWDVAAGILLVREAGGIVVDHRGTTFRTGGPVVVAGAEVVVRQLLPVIRSHLPSHVATAL